MFLRIAYLTAVRKLVVLGVASLVALGARIAVLCGPISDHVAILADGSGTDVQQSGQARDEEKTANHDALSVYAKVGRCCRRCVCSQRE